MCLVCALIDGALPLIRIYCGTQTRGLVSLGGNTSLDCIDSAIPFGCGNILKASTCRTTAAAGQLSSFHTICIDSAPARLGWCGHCWSCTSVTPVKRLSTCRLLHLLILPLLLVLSCASFYFFCTLLTCHMSQRGLCAESLLCVCRLPVVLPHSCPLWTRCKAPARWTSHE